MALVAISVAGYMNQATGDVFIDEDDLAVAGEETGEIGEEVGATRRRLVHRGSGRPAPRDARGNKRVQVKSGLLGLGTATVAAVTDGTLDADAQEPCYLQRLLLDGDTADFSLKDVKVGSKSIFSGTESVPAGMFRPDATGAPFAFKHRLRVGQTVTVSVRNNNAAQKVLSGAFKTIEQANS